eukprot:3298122-Pleurochrysis_carterae.AAC.1
MLTLLCAATGLSPAVNSQSMRAFSHTAVQMGSSGICSAGRCSRNILQPAAITARTVSARSRSPVMMLDPSAFSWLADAADVAGEAAGAAADAAQGDWFDLCVLPTVTQ